MEQRLRHPSAAGGSWAPSCDAGGAVVLGGGLGVAVGSSGSRVVMASCEEEGGISRPSSSSSGCLRRLLLPTEAPPLVFWFPAKHRSSVVSSCCQSEL